MGKKFYLILRVFTYVEKLEERVFLPLLLYHVFSRTNSYLVKYSWVHMRSTLPDHTFHPLFRPNSVKSLSPFGYSQLYLIVTTSKIILRFFPKLGYHYPFPTEFLRKVLFFFHLPPLYLMLLGSTVSFSRMTLTASNPVQVSTGTFLDFYNTLVSPLFLHSSHCWTPLLSGTVNSHV